MKRHDLSLCELDQRPVDFDALEELRLKNLFTFEKFLSPDHHLIGSARQLVLRAQVGRRLPRAFRHSRMEHDQYFHDGLCQHLVQDGFQ